MSLARTIRRPTSTAVMAVLVLVSARGLTDDTNQTAESGAAADECPDNTKIASYPELRDTTRRTIERALDLFKRSDSSPHWDAMIQKGRAGLKGVARRDKKTPLPEFYLGMSYFETMLYDAAEKWLEKALKASPTFHEAHLVLARVKIIAKDYKAALTHTEKALEICPKFLPAAYIKSECLVRLNRIEDALRFFDESPATRDLPRTFDEIIELEEEEVRRNPPRRPPPVPDSTVVDEAKAAEEAEKEAELELRRSGTRLRVLLQRAVDGPEWGRGFVKESKHYRISTPVSQAFADEASERAELIHELYRKLFPKIKRPKRKYEVWIYGSEEEYINSGAPVGTAGYYDTTFRRLVLYYEERNLDYTYSVLQHEAFHQFFDDYVRIAPPWFNEGLGEYFGAFELYKRGKKSYLRSPRDLGQRRSASALVRSRGYTPLPIFLRMNQEYMYRRAGVHYAQALSLVHFMLEGVSYNRDVGVGLVTKRTYRKVLLEYFNQIRRGKNPVQAYDATFAKIDLKMFEEDWIDFASRQ